MSDHMKIMKDRGKNLFITKMNQAIEILSSIKNVQPETKKQLEQLRDFFQDQVAISEPIDHSCFAAARMAKSCIDVAYNGVADMATLIEQVLSMYRTAPVGHVTPVVEESDAQLQVKADLQKEIEKHQAKVDATGTEVIDLLQSVKLADLRTEGKRAIGLLPANFDPTKDNEEDYAVEDNCEPLYAIPFQDPDGGMTWACPSCHSTDLVLEMSSGYCLNCDCEFEMPISLGDVISDEPIEQVPQIILPNEANHRIDGKIKNRGKIIKGE